MSVLWMCCEFTHFSYRLVDCHYSIDRMIYLHEINPYEQLIYYLMIVELQLDFLSDLVFIPHFFNIVMEVDAWTVTCLIARVFVKQSKLMV